MEPRTAATRVPDPDAAEFVRFCYRRRRVGWPELYDEMCAVASRGLYRGFGTDDLAALGIGFALFDMPALAALANRVVAEEQALRRPVTVTIAPAMSETVAAAVIADAAAIASDAAVATPTPLEAPSPAEPASTPSIRFIPVPAGA